MSSARHTPHEDCQSQVYVCPVHHHEHYVLCDVLARFSKENLRRTTSDVPNPSLLPVRHVARCAETETG